MDRDQIEKMTRDYQVMQEQLQSLAIQKEQFSGQKEELKEAMSELEKAAGKIYVAIGGVMVEQKKDEAVKSVKERQETLDMRLSIITKQLDDLSKKEKSLREEITTVLKDMKQ
ncbi:MAG: prefoldin subunit [Candidatus Micrarchaeota archaeon]|nr:prefoldin subunit [Candidatus Micrarchaeota archaeon]